MHPIRRRWITRSIPEVLIVTVGLKLILPLLGLRLHMWLFFVAGMLVAIMDPL